MNLFKAFFRALAFRDKLIKAMYANQFFGDYCAGRADAETWPAQNLAIARQRFIEAANVHYAALPQMFRGDDEAFVAAERFLNGQFYHVCPEEKAYVKSMQETILREKGYTNEAFAEMARRQHEYYLGNRVMT